MSAFVLCSTLRGPRRRAVLRLAARLGQSAGRFGGREPERDRGSRHRRHLASSAAAGSAWSALLGILVIQAISPTGLTLLNLSSSSLRYMITGGGSCRRCHRGLASPASSRVSAMAGPETEEEDPIMVAKLDGKLAAVTGAASGIGLECVRAYPCLRKGQGS